MQHLLAMLADDTVPLVRQVEPLNILDLYSYNEKPTRCTISQIYLIKYSTCFGQVHCPSSGMSQHCIHAIGICRASFVGACASTMSLRTVFFTSLYFIL